MIWSAKINEQTNKIESKAINLNLIKISWWNLLNREICMTLKINIDSANRTAHKNDWHAIYPINCRVLSAVTMAERRTERGKNLWWVMQIHFTNTHEPRQTHATCFTKQRDSKGKRQSRVRQRWTAWFSISMPQMVDHSTESSQRRLWDPLERVSSAQ